MKPIIFKPELVEAILRGEKTQTRRLNHKHEPREELYVRETFWQRAYREEGPGPDRANPVCPAWVYGESPDDVHYIGEGLERTDDAFARWRKRPGIHMPRWCSRVHLVAKDVTIERLSEATEQDAVAEGFQNLAAFREKWDAINPKTPWISNPLVCVIDFEVTWRAPQRKTA